RDGGAISDAAGGGNGLAAAAALRLRDAVGSLAARFGIHRLALLQESALPRDPAVFVALAIRRRGAAALARDRRRAFAAAMVALDGPRLAARGLEVAGTRNAAVCVALARDLGLPARIGLALRRARAGIEVG